MTTLHRFAVPGLLLALACGGLPERTERDKAPPYDYFGNPPVGEPRDPGPVPDADTCSTEASQKVCATLVNGDDPAIPPGVDLNCYCVWETRAKEISFRWKDQKVALRNASETTRVSTPLYLAVDKHASLEVIEAMLAAGAHPNLPRHPYKTPPTGPASAIHPLWPAIDKRGPEVVGPLLKAGADLDLVRIGTPSDRTIVFLHQNGVPLKDLPTPHSVGPEGARALAKIGFPLAQQAADGWTLIHRAALEPDLETVRVLLELGVDPNLPMDDGRRPIHVAASRTLSREDAERVEMVKLLLDAGADPKPAGRDKTPLQAAREDKFEQMVKLLEANGG